MEWPAVLRTKADGTELDPSQIRYFVDAAARGSVPDEDLIEMLHAICEHGLSYAETLSLTKAMSASGEQLTWPGHGDVLVDKHSTGGVGDKVTMLLLPWVASAGLKVAKLSGKGLGHTGGTIDKLGSIPGFRTSLDSAEMRSLLSSVGCCVAQQSSKLVPADAKLYALRDVSNTVMQLGLIASSVMSKKLAGGARNIVLDVKCGSGALFSSEAQAREFANLALRIARDCGRRAACVISNMDEPLGSAIGNALEVAEVLDVLEWRSEQPRLVELCEVLGGVMLCLVGLAKGVDEARGQLKRLRKDGKVRERFHAWVGAQGGDIQAFRQQMAGLDALRLIRVELGASAVLDYPDTHALGDFVRRLGAGRRKTSDEVNPLVGVKWLGLAGRRLDGSMLVAKILASRNDPREDESLRNELLDCVRVCNAAFSPKPLIYDVLWS